MWRFGCFFVAALAMLIVVVAAVAWLVAVALGVDIASEPARALAIGLLLVGFVLVLGVGRGARRFFGPVRALVEAAGRIEEGDYGARVPERGPREVRSLARAFNAMSARLEATDRQRRSFLADVTHELRTPLSVIRGQIEAIQEGVYAADEEHLAPILDATRALEQLVEDVRTLALAESGSLTLAREPVDLSVLTSESVAAFRAAADAAGVTLEADVPSDLPPVDADPVRLRGVLGNLVANALRHTPAGGAITVGLHAVAGPPDRDAETVEVAVHDTGRGIPAELLPRVFERFAKASDSPGSGLGLAIARDVVAAHGGTIVAESEPGHGTTIRFTLPVRPPPP
jgi:signal transduction histidine kinase